MDIKDEIELLSPRQKLSPEVLNKPVISLADNMQDRLDKKVDKVLGKSLSDNNYDGVSKQKVDRITLSQNINLDDIQVAIDGLVAAVVLKGSWDPSTNSFPISAKPGFSYIVSAPGTISGIDFNVNDRLLCISENPSLTVYAENWLKLDYTDQVLSVAGKTGEVTLADINLDQVDNTSDINKPISTVAQSALNTKTDKTTKVIAAAGLVNGGDLSGDVTVGLGLPSNITISTTNSTSAESHTHTLVLNKGDIGLSNVDNTSDLNKPLSSASSSALSTKTDKTTTVKGTGALTGGGALSSNVSIDASQITKASLALADTAVQHSDLGTAAYVDKYTAGSNISINPDNVITATDTKFTAGKGLSLNGTEFTLPISTTSQGTFIESATQGLNGLIFNLGTPPDTKYAAGSGITLSGTTFTVPVSTTGTGTHIESVTQEPNGIKVTKSTPIDTRYTAGSGLSLSGTEFTLPVSFNGSGTYVSNVTQTEAGILITRGTPPDNNTTYLAGTGLTLTGNTFSTNFGTVAGTSVQGNDPRIVNAASDSSVNAGLATKVDKIAGKELSDQNYTIAEKNKLSGIATGATLNSTDAQLRARSTHTGEQTILTVTGLRDELDSKVDAVLGKTLSDENYSLVEKNKLAGVSAGSTKNSTDAQLRDRGSHTGTQPVSSVVGLQAGLDTKVDKIAGKGLSDQNYTLAEKNKLSGLESSKWRGLFTSPTGLPASGQPGDYADVDAGTGQDVQRFIWDSSDSKWIAQGGNVAPLTGAQIKSLYEAQPDTNAYLDAEKSKLSGIATGATKNATDAAIRARSSHTGEQAISTVTGLQASLNSKVDTEAGKSLIADSDVVKLSGIASGATQNSTDESLRNRSTHTGTQAVSTITGLGNTATHNYGTAAGTVAQGNDSRINNGQTAFSWGNHASAGYIKSFTNTTYTAGTGLTLTGTIFSTNFGTTAGTAAQGNDSRIVNAVQTRKTIVVAAGNLATGHEGQVILKTGNGTVPGALPIGWNCSIVADGAARTITLSGTERVMENTAVSFVIPTNMTADIVKIKADRWVVSLLRTSLNIGL